MKKQRKKTLRKISRKKGVNEPEIDIEYQNQISELATQFREDQLKLVLRRCYKNVQKYGPEAILRAVEDNWASLPAGSVNTSVKDFVKIEEERSQVFIEETLTPTEIFSGTLHPHNETAKNNAEFLIESSERIDYYDSDTLAEMKRAYEKDNFDDVADIAYLHDRCQRPQSPPERQQIDDKPQTPKKPESPWKRISELLAEVAEEDQAESPLKCCVEAVRHLSCDLTYDSRTAAKESIRKAIKHLEE